MKETYKIFELLFIFTQIQKIKSSPSSSLSSCFSISHRQFFYSYSAKIYIINVCGCWSVFTIETLKSIDDFSLFSSLRLKYF